MNRRVVMKYLLSAGSVVEISPDNILKQISVKPVIINSNDDIESLTEDWANVGNDLRKAMAEHERTNRKQRSPVFD